MRGTWRSGSPRPDHPHHTHPTSAPHASAPQTSAPQTSAPPKRPRHKERIRVSAWVPPNGPVKLFHPHSRKRSMNGSVG
jgi:hypothetical protein